MAAGLATLCLLSWLMPPRAFAGFASRVSKPARLSLGVNDAHIEKVSSLFGCTPEKASSILTQLSAMDLHATMELLRCYRPGRRTPPPVVVRGGEHIETGLAAGCGVILWIAHFVENPLTSKVSLARAGFSIHHLSHPRHGFSMTRFGMRLLNKVRTCVEDRYLAERVSLGLGSSKGALDRLREHLEANRIVSIGARATSRRPLEVPFLNGTVELAPGAPVMAKKTGATLLPAVPLREASGLSMTIGPPLQSDCLQTQAQSFMKWTAPYVTRFPEQWLGWLTLR